MLGATEHQNKKVSASLEVFNTYQLSGKLVLQNGF